jgi:hypothetical protein
MLQKLFSLLLLAVLLFPGGVQAQEGAAFSSVFVQLWPEFDQPSMLVMYQITLSPQVELPSEVRFRIPAAAGKPNAVATCEQPDAPCNNTPYTQETPIGEWSTLVIPVTLSADLRIEYYDPRIDMTTANRSFDYVWPGDHSVENFSVQVQQPLRAANMTIRPGMAQSATAQDGMNYYTLAVGAVPNGQPVELGIEYAKDNDELSNNSLGVAPAEPLEENSGALPLSSKTITALLALLGTLLIVGGGAWYWLNSRQTPAVEPGRRRNRRKPLAEAAADDGGNIYCHQCGNRASPGDRFCRVCGAALRKP